jgi:hypothetical protein
MWKLRAVKSECVDILLLYPFARRTSFLWTFCCCIHLLVGHRFCGHSVAVSICQPDIVFVDILLLYPFASRASFLWTFCCCIHLPAGHRLCGYSVAVSMGEPGVVNEDILLR